MADFDEVWCIDAGKSSLKAVKLQRSGNGAEVVAVEKIDNPGGSDVDTSAAAVSTLAARHNLSGALVVTIPSRSALTSFIDVPPVDGKKLEELIGYEAQQNIPLPIDEVIWGSHVGGESEIGEREISIFAVRSEEVSDLLVDYGQDNLEIDLLTLGNVALLNLIRFDLRPTRPVVALEIGSDHTDLIIVNGSRFWFRSLPIAGKDFTQALQDKFGCSAEDAENLKVTAARSEHAAKIFKELQPLLRDLVSEINRSIGYYKSRVGEIKVEDLFLFGGSSKLVGLRKFLEENLRIRVQMIKNFNRVRIGSEAMGSGIQQDLGTYGSVVGAGLQALGLGEVDLNLLPQEKQEAVEFQKKQKTVLVSAASLYLLILFFVFSFSGKIEQANVILGEAKVVKGLKANEKKLSKMEKEESKQLADQQEQLLARGTGRLSPREIMGIVSQVVSGGDMGKILSQRVENGPDKDAILGQVEGDQELLNREKTWLSGIDMKKVLVDEFGTVKELNAKISDGVKVYGNRYLVVVEGYRYDAGDATSNDQILKQQIVAPIENKLEELFGEGEAHLTRQVGAETRLMWAKHETIKTKNVRGSKAEASEDHGVTLFPWKVTWIHPPLPVEDDDFQPGDEG